MEGEEALRRRRIVWSEPWPVAAAPAECHVPTARGGGAVTRLWGGAPGGRQTVSRGRAATPSLRRVFKDTAEFNGSMHIFKNVN